MWFYAMAKWTTIWERAVTGGWCCPILDGYYRAVEQAALASPREEAASTAHRERDE